MDDRFLNPIEKGIDILTTWVIPALIIFAAALLIVYNLAIYISGPTQ